jgi:hypothetical protein
MRTGPNPSGLCMCGCGEKTTLAGKTSAQSGAVQGTPTKYVFGHQRRLSPVEYLVDPASGCWLWQRSKDRHGYGQVRKDGRLVYAHRRAFERHVGPIPKGLYIDHLCRNPACVNPAHLEPVTHGENLRRGASAKLTHQRAREIRASAADAKTLAKRYGVTVDTVRAVIQGRSWPEDEAAAA